MVYEALLLFAVAFFAGWLFSSPAAGATQRTAGARYAAAALHPGGVRRLLPVVLAARRPDAGDEGLAHPAGAEVTPRKAICCASSRVAAGAHGDLACCGRCSIATGSSCTTASPAPRLVLAGSAAPRHHIISTAASRNATLGTAAAANGGQFCSRPMCENRLFSMWKKMPSMMPRNTLTPTMPGARLHVGEGQRERHHHQRGERVEQLLPQRDLVALGLLPVGRRGAGCTCAAPRPTCARARTISAFEQVRASPPSAIPTARRARCAGPRA